MAGRVCVVTGANAGIGFETTKALAAMGATVVMACRDRGRADAARARIADALGRDAAVRLELMLVDLARQDDIRRFCKELVARHPRVHVLINNAGFHTATRTLTPDGRESTWAVDHLAPFLMTNLLRPALEAAAPARVVTVASEAHRGAKIRWDDVEGARRWSGIHAYRQAKLANIMFSSALARRLAGSRVTSNAVHPGSVRTGWGRKGSGGLRVVVTLVTPFLISARRGARTSVHVATAPELETVTGKYFVRCREARPSKAALDVEAQERLWKESAAMVGL